MPERKLQRTLTLKVAIDWKKDADKALYRRLRDLSWQAAAYRNSMIRRKWAESMGFRMAESDDKHSVSKDGRRHDKGELSGDAYSCAEQEVAGAWSRDAKLVLAGRQLPEWKTNAALSVTGKEIYKDSGVRLEIDGDKITLNLRAQAKTCEGGSWLALPIAPQSKRDEYQGEILGKMADWSIPIKKATVHLNSRGIKVRLSYALIVPELKPMGKRVAVLGPIGKDGRLHLRIEDITRRDGSRDYTSRLLHISRQKENWDGIRRRITSQVGWRKGQARTKRELLLHRSWDDWLQSHLHSWSRDAADWCASQGIGEIQLQSIDTGDWPAWKFTSMLKYKCEALGISVVNGASVQTKAGETAAKAKVSKTGRQVRKRAEAIRELSHQLKERIA